MQETQKAGRIGMVSLGCPKALVDSERILTQLKVEGYEVVPDYQSADIVVVNTCGFIDSAVQESLDAIGEALRENGKVIVTGCLGAKQAADGANLIETMHPKVLAVTGPHAADEVMLAVHTHLPRPHDPFVDLVPDHGVKLTPKHYAYLKISEGCNHRCSFCIIPSMRGDLVSRPVGEVMREAESLVKSGVKELLVVSQDTSAYGVDLKYRTDFVNGRPVRTRFTELARELGQLGVWVRMHYVYPYPHVDEVLELMADNRILPYLDVPFQHSHPDVLKRMKRPASGEKNMERIAAWRKQVPHLTIRSTFIAGFPGETQEEFDHLKSFLSEAQLDRVGVFSYSPVEGASANNLDNPVAEGERDRRRDELMALQEGISEKRQKAKLGTRQKVIVDAAVEGGYIGRTMADAPEIDGQVHMPKPAKTWLRPKVGDIVTVKVSGHDAYDLSGDIV